MHPFAACCCPWIRGIVGRFDAEIAFHPNNRRRRDHAFEIADTQRRHRPIRLVSPQREIVFACRFRSIAARVECDQSLLHVRARRLGFASQQARIIDKLRSRALQMFQRRLRKRFAPRREIELSETFARIPQTLRRIFLHQTGRERHAFAGRFEQRIELPQRDRALLARAEIK